MSLPETIRTRISSEAAGYISLTPVEQREITIADLIRRILALTGKNPARILEILKRGSLVSGAARFRWESIEAEPATLSTILDRFPDPDPSRPFDGSKCRLVILRSARGTLLELPRDVVSQRRLLKRQSFWDVLLPTLEALAPRYERYSYSETADVYVARLEPPAMQNLREHRALLKFSSLAQQLELTEFENAELFVER